MCTFGGATAGSWIAGLLSDAYRLDNAIAALALFSALCGVLALILAAYLRRQADRRR